jgi:ABC-type amino acid transport substrate-binding protein
MARGRVLAAGGLAACVALLLAASGTARGIKEGGTFRIGIISELFDSVDGAVTATPATIPVRRATCASLLTTPDKPFPEGARVVPELAAGFPKVTAGGRTHTFTRSTARSSRS